MALNFLTNLNVPALPENEVWFLNSAAWTNYWASINIQGSFDAYGNAAYVESIYNNALEGYNLNYGEVAYAFPSQAQFNSLLAAYQTLNINYKTLRSELVAIGLLENL